MSDWRTIARRAVAYPVIFVLAMILIGPTIPLDFALLVIASAAAMLGVSKSSAPAFGITDYVSGRFREILRRLRA